MVFKLNCIYIPNTILKLYISYYLIYIPNAILKLYISYYLIQLPIMIKIPFQAYEKP
ncbi:hypothetical protein HanXRQr2_Chr15g0710061 [Helianthus annuus]|uniref:Uncharacterized protein n=1 Tax=Helianthus annuus TaxID=4232 RepID=A0A9K3E302_HELAN|nr:hypothetical protein HanXRQr2_Chr15g0710061 [Helianthus annuus]